MATGRVRIARFRDDGPRPREDDIISFGVVPIEGEDVPRRSTYREVRPDRPLKPPSMRCTVCAGGLEEASALWAVVDDRATPWRDGTCSRGPRRSKRRSWRGRSGVGPRGEGGCRRSFSLSSSRSRSVATPTSRSPPSPISWAFRGTSASRARRCIDDRGGLPRPAAGAGAARDHDTSTATSCRSGVRATSPAASRARSSPGHVGRTWPPSRSSEGEGDGELQRDRCGRCGRKAVPIEEGAQARGPRTHRRWQRTRSG